MRLIYEGMGQSGEIADKHFGEWEKQTGKVWASANQEEKVPDDFLGKMKYLHSKGQLIPDFTAKDVLKMGADAASGAVPGLVTGNPLAAIGGGLVNMYANAGQPVTSAGNIANVAAGPLGKASQMAMKGSRLLQTTLPIAENVGATFAGRTGAEAFGTPSPLPAETEYGLAAGVPAALNIPTALAVKGSKMAPGIWQRLISESSPKAKPEALEQTMTALKKMGDSSVEGTAALKTLRDLENKQATLVNRLPGVQQSTMELRKKAVDTRKRLQEILNKKAERGFLIDDEIIASKAAQTEAQKIIQDSKGKLAEGQNNLKAEKARLKIINHERPALPEEELRVMELERDTYDQAADLNLDIAALENTIEDQAKYQRDRANVAKFNTKNKTQTEIDARIAKTEAQQESQAAKSALRNLKRQIDTGSYDIGHVQRSLDDISKRTGFDPQTMSPESRELLLSISEKSPEIVIRSIMSDANSNSKIAIKNLMQVAGDDPVMQGNLRAAMAKELVRPGEVFTHGTASQIAQAGKIPQEFLGRVQDLGEDTINDIYNSKNAYKNLVAYGKLLEKAQQKFPNHWAEGSVWKLATMMGGGYFALPFIMSKLGPAGTAAVAAPAAMMYLNVQAPAFVNYIIRGNPTVSKLFQSMAQNPEKFMSGSAGSRLLTAYLRKSADKAMFENNGKPMEIKLNGSTQETGNASIPLGTRIGSMTVVP